MYNQQIPPAAGGQPQQPPPQQGGGMASQFQMPPARPKMGGPRQAPPQRRTIRRSMPPQAFGSQMQFMQQQLQAYPQPQPQPTVITPTRAPQYPTSPPQQPQQVASPPANIPPATIPQAPIPSQIPQPSQIPSQIPPQAPSPSAGVPPPMRAPVAPGMAPPQMHAPVAPGMGLPPQMPASSMAPPQGPPPMRAPVAPGMAPPQMHAPVAPAVSQPPQASIPSASIPPAAGIQAPVVAAVPPAGPAPVAVPSAIPPAAAAGAGAPGGANIQPKFKPRNPMRKSMFPRLQMIRAKGGMDFQSGAFTSPINSMSSGSASGSGSATMSPIVAPSATTPTAAAAAAAATSSGSTGSSPSMTAQNYAQQPPLPPTQMLPPPQIPPPSTSPQLQSQSQSQMPSFPQSQFPQSQFQTSQFPPSQFQQTSNIPPPPPQPTTPPPSIPEITPPETTTGIPEIPPPPVATEPVGEEEQNNNNNNSNNNNGEEEGSSSPVLYSIVVEPEVDESAKEAEEAAERERAAAREKAEKEAAARAAKEQEELVKVSPESLIYTKKEIGVLQDILDLFIEKSPQTIGHLFEKVSKDKFDEFANAMVTLSFAHSTTLPLVLYFVGDEFARNGHLEGGLKVLFRENSVASKMLKAYLAHVGGPYLQELLGDLVRDICFVEQKVSFEIDPGRAEGGAAEVERNLAALTAKLEAFMQRITSASMVARMPQGIRAIAAYFAESSKKYWPDKPSDILLGSFLMLRYINPAIAAPETAGLLPKSGRNAGQAVSPKARRNLLLITKVLQNMSNCVLFTQKEQYMLPLNGFLQTYMPKLQRYYQSIIAAADACSANLVFDSDIVEPGPREAHNFHRMLFAFRGEIVPALLPDPEDQARLGLLMETLGSYARKASFPNVLGADPERQAPVRQLLAKYHDAPVFVAPYETTPESAGGSFYSLGPDGLTAEEDSEPASNDNVVIVGANRIFVVRRKPFKGSILRCCGHLLDLVEIRSRGTRELKLTFKTFAVSGFCNAADEVIECAIRAYMANFGTAPPAQRFRIDAAPQHRAEAAARIFAAGAAEAEASASRRGAAALLGTYASLCDYYGLQVNEGVSWDLENLYEEETTLDLRRFGFDDGGSSEQEELGPLFHALRYDKHFKGIICEGLRLKSVVPQLGETLRLNSALTVLTLADAGLNDKMVVTLFDALASNKGCAITTVDLSHNTIEEKGALAIARFVCTRALAAATSAASSPMTIPPPSIPPPPLAGAAPSSASSGSAAAGAVDGALFTLPEGVDPGVVVLNLEGSIDSGKAVSALGVELAKVVHPTLRVLNMARNKIGDSFADIGVFLHIGGAEIVDLDISGTLLSGAKLTGFLQYVAKGCKRLARLGAANLKFSRPEDILFVSQMLISNNSLRDLDLSGSLPNARCLGDLLVCAHADASVRISIANNSFSDSVNVLYQFLPKIKALSHLDLSNTDLGDDGIFHVAEALALNTALRSLNVSGCFHPDKRPRQDAIHAIEKLVNSDCPLEELYIAGGQKTGQQIGKYLPQLLQAFRSNKKITVLDVSGHAAGPRGALALSKLLTVNKTLREVRIDQNNIGLNGLSVIAQSLKAGSSLVSFPLPIIDIAAMINTSIMSTVQKKIHILCMEIEKSLINNNNK